MCSKLFLCISLPLLHNYDVKMPIFTFYGGRKQKTTEVSFSVFINLDIVLSNSTPGELAYIWKGNWIGIIAMKTERTRIRDVFAAVPVLKS